MNKDSSLEACKRPRGSSSKKKENPNADQSSRKNLPSQGQQIGSPELFESTRPFRGKTLRISVVRPSHSNPALGLRGTLIRWAKPSSSSQGWVGCSVRVDPSKRCVQAISSGSHHRRSTGTVRRRKRPCHTSRYRNLWTARWSIGLKKSVTNNTASDCFATDRDAGFAANLAGSTIIRSRSNGENSQYAEVTLYHSSAVGRADSRGISCS
jgi:hypothetical protein